jgi:hypothetical protein
VPVSITFAPVNPSVTGAPTIPDTVVAGTLVASVVVGMSDGSPFAGTLSLTGPGGSMFAVSGMQIVTARALTSADDGTQSVTVTAAQGAGAAWRRLI